MWEGNSYWLPHDWESNLPCLMYGTKLQPTKPHQQVCLRYFLTSWVLLTWKNTIVIICAHAPFLSCVWSWVLEKSKSFYNNSLLFHNSAPLLLPHIYLSPVYITDWDRYLGKLEIQLLSFFFFFSLSHLGEPGHPGSSGKDGMRGQKGEQGQKSCSIWPCSNSEPLMT